MSVIVMGMEMPERCETCDLICDDDSGLEVCCCTGEIVDREEQARPRWCPLRPLPEKHGRLGDIDAIMEEIKNSRIFKGDYLIALMDIVDGARTIVEAEGE